MNLISLAKLLRTIKSRVRKDPPMGMADACADGNSEDKEGEVGIAWEDKCIFVLLCILCFH